MVIKTDEKVSQLSLIGLDRVEVFYSSRSRFAISCILKVKTDLLHFRQWREPTQLINNTPSRRWVPVI
jgi:hypothetical protein